MRKPFSPELLEASRQVRPPLPTISLESFADALDTEFGAMRDLLVDKRRSYGPNNLVRFGGLGIVIRASDKIDRLATMYADKTDICADGDTMEDAWRDLIGYGILGLLHHIDDQRARQELLSGEAYPSEPPPPPPLRHESVISASRFDPADGKRLEDHDK